MERALRSDMVVQAILPSGRVKAQVRVPRPCTGIELKFAIQTHARVHVSEQRLLLNGRELQDGEEISMNDLVAIDPRPEHALIVNLVLAEPANEQRGSALHGTGRCTPCKKYWSLEGCDDLDNCELCHKCRKPKVPSCCGKIGWRVKCTPCSQCRVELDEDEVVNPVVKRSHGIAAKRLEKELREMREDPIAHCNAEPSGDNLFLWNATIVGPKGSPYEDGVFNLSIVIPKDYPFDPPSVHFTTMIYHCNVNESGGVCMNILDTEWIPQLTISKILLSLLCLLAESNPEDALRPEIAGVLLQDVTKHNQIAREYVMKYATKNTISM